jgi:hypothetical protein
MNTQLRRLETELAAWNGIYADAPATNSSFSLTPLARTSSKSLSALSLTLGQLR